MKHIQLNQTVKFTENATNPKYYREIECHPQSARLETWGSDNPLFIFEGVVTIAEDEREIGMTKDVYIQSYSFWLADLVKTGKYSIIN